MIYEVWFGEVKTALRVEFDDEIYIDSLEKQVGHLREEYDGPLWLRKTNDDKLFKVNDIIVVMKTPPSTSVPVGTLSVITKITKPSTGNPDGYYEACDGYLFAKEEIRLATDEEIRKALIKYKTV